MEPKHNNDYLPAVELPHLQEVSGQIVGPEQIPAAPEARGTSYPSGGVASGSGAAQSTPIGVPSVNDGSAGQPQSSPASVSNSGLIADDADLIEKEWVLKAKAIVNHTRSDPHQQNIEMTNIKADYLKKRYNKDLKTSGG